MMYSRSSVPSNPLSTWSLSRRWDIPFFLFFLFVLWAHFPNSSLRNRIGLFRQVKKYETPTWQARAAALTEYIGRVMECIEEELSKVCSFSSDYFFEGSDPNLRSEWQQGTVNRVVLVLRENSINQTPFERYVFDFEWLIRNEDFPKDGGDFVWVSFFRSLSVMLTNGSSTCCRPRAGGANRGDVEDWFKGCLRRLNASASFLKKLPAGEHYHENLIINCFSF